jgi:hypothetical protein
VLSLRCADESGSGLIWFISLLAVVALFSGTLASASHEFLFARRVTDYTEEYVLAVKTKLNLDSRALISEVGKNVFLETASHFSFSKLRVRSIDLQAGQTVHAVVCASWSPPVSFLTGSREICEEAYAR